MLFALEDIGSRDYQEDRHDVAFNVYKDMNYYAIFDGHGDEKVAVFMKLYFKDILVQELVNGEKEGKNIPQCMFSAFHRVQSIIPRSIATFAGCTAVVILHQKDMIYVANVGDSRAISCNGFQAMEITQDHKPALKSEYDRIHSVGGSVILDPYGTPRVNGSLALSRAIGDFYLSPAVIGMPDIYAMTIKEHNKYVLAATDGLWDAMQNQEVVDQLKPFLSTDNIRSNPKAVLNGACLSLLKTARQRGSGDNITILLIMLN
jgi:protein phosphatase 1L